MKRKHDIDNEVKRYKARWVWKDVEQRERINYFETFVAVIKVSINKVLFAIIVNKNVDSY